MTEGNVLFDVWLMARATAAAIDEAVSAAGLDADEFAVYSMLATGPDAAVGMRPSDLSRWMSAPPTTVSSYLKRFGRRGHLERSPDGNDARSHRVRLTAEGLAAHRAAATHFEPLLTKVNEALGSEVSSTRERLLWLHRILSTS